MNSPLPILTNAGESPPLQFKVHGLDCHEEVQQLESALVPLVRDRERLEFDLLQGKMEVRSDLSTDQILSAIKTAGFKAELWAEWQRNHRAGASLPVVSTSPFRFGWTEASTLCIALAWLIHLLVSGRFLATFHDLQGLHGSNRIAVISLYLLGILTAFRPIFPHALQSLRHLRPDMYLLMSLAVVGAILLGEWQEAAAVACLFAWSLRLESWTLARARRAIRALLDLTPQTVRQITDHGHDHVVPVEELNVDDSFRVLAGEVIALDGTVLTGQGFVNQAPVTGESFPIPKHPGENVLAGTINGQVPLEIRVTQRVENSTLARMTKLVESAQKQKSRAESWVEQFARIYTPAVFALAALVWLVPVLVAGTPLWVAVRPALVLLVIACPCALVISTPVSVVAALASCARRGILVKGGRILEIPASLRAIALDKTGTLTTGRMVVAEIFAPDKPRSQDLLHKAASLEQFSTHPVGQAILGYARDHRMTLSSATNVQEFPGKGIQGEIDGHRYSLGSAAWLTELHALTPDQRPLMNLDGDSSLIGLANSDGMLGWIVIRQEMRDGLAQLVLELRDAGLQHVVMLTGDQTGPAQSAARRAGIEDIRAELLPAQKLQAIEELVAKYRSVAMVGDGINDTPALARATLGIAMGTSGTDAALETADVALIGDDLQKIPWLIRHSHRMRAVLRENITLALSVKLLFAGMALAGWSSMWGAVAADMGTTLLVVANALRLLRNPD
ncbi:MAG: cation-translocating P-type ATPase [Planctomycetales bacterium]